MWFNRKKQANEVQNLSSALDVSFKNVRQDIYNIFSWVNFLNDRLLSLQKQLDNAPKAPEEVRRIMENEYSFDALSRKVTNLNEQLEGLEQKQRQIPHELDVIREKLHKMASADVKRPAETETIARTETSKLDEISERLKNIEEQRRKNLRDTMARKLTRNSKEYIMNIIVSLIRKYGKIPALKLKEMIVDEQGLCSKSTFYRLLNEVQEESEVSVAHKGKEKQIVFKLK